MKNKNEVPFLNIGESKLPIYKQIVEQVTLAVNNKTISSGFILPSINDLSKQFKLSRDTVQKAYSQLKKMGVISSVHGKGFYISTDKVLYKIRVFVLFDVLFTNFKEELYYAIADNLDEDECQLDVYYHHQNPDVFRDVINRAYGNYDRYIVMPLTNNNEQVFDVYDKLAGDNNVLLLDMQLQYPNYKFNRIVQSHDVGFEKALQHEIDRIKKYKQLTLVFPEDRYHPQTIKNAFERFCRNNGLEFKIVAKLTSEAVQVNTLFILLENSDLVRLIKHCRSEKPKLAIDIGCIAYNDSPLKEIIEGGISVISVDFPEMGRKTANFIKNPHQIDVVLPTQLIVRKSF